MEKPFEIVEPSKLDEWLNRHPSGYLVAKSTRYPDNTASVAYSQLVKNEYLVVLKGSDAAEVSVR